MAGAKKTPLQGDGQDFQNSSAPRSRWSRGRYSAGGFIKKRPEGRGATITLVAGLENCRLQDGIDYF